MLVILSVRSLALNSDGAFLLSFKYSVLSDPLSVLDNWNYDDDTPCLWTGVTCAEIVGNLSGTPEMFRVISLVLPNSQLLGSIPEDLGLIQNLRSLDLSGNFLNGTLPSSLFNSSELRVISLAGNVISGELPKFIAGLKSLQLLNLSDNALAGKVPQNLTSLQNLTVVSLRSNYFSGAIPSGFRSVEVLDMSSNLLNGSLPLDFGGENMRYLNISYNNLSGSVSPEFVKKIPINATIDLSFNNLTGEIPQTAGLSNQITEAFIGNADLCGKPLKKICTIPSMPSNPPNVTTNTTSPAIAVVPRNMDPTPLTNSHNTLNPGTIAGISVGGLSGIGVLVMISLLVYQSKKKKRNLVSLSISNACSVNKEETKETKSLATCSCLSVTGGEEMFETTGSDTDNQINDDNYATGRLENEEREKYKKARSLVMVDGETEIELETLLKASAYVLGSSGSSIVYRAVLEDGATFAVRRIGDTGVKMLKEFENRVKAVAKLRHPNLVRVRGFYWGDDEKLVIYDYVSNGSLATVGHKRVGSSSPCRLPFQARLKIARGVARALTYIHEKKQVHGNVKPSNILLTPEMEPVISDFGLDWLVSGKHSYKTNAQTRHFGSKGSISTREDPQDLPNGVGFMGCTSPYHAPESLKNLKPNPKWDVYSFGIVLLELLTGKVFSDRELGQWARGSAVEDKDRILRITDVAIRVDMEDREDVTLSCYKLGFSCASLIPQRRPSMKDALQVLEKMPCSH